MVVVGYRGPMYSRLGGSASTPVTHWLLGPSKKVQLCRDRRDRSNDVYWEIGFSIFTGNFI